MANEVSIYEPRHLIEVVRTTPADPHVSAGSLFLQRENLPDPPR